MPYYAITAKDRPGGLEHRKAVRPVHLQHLESLGDRLILAGPFQDENGDATGSFMVVEAESLEAARALFAEDPFIKEGVFGEYQVSRWALTINKSAGR